MTNSKKRRDIEVYENYWNFTASHLDITGTKFNNCLNIIILFIDKNKNALDENEKKELKFSESELYKKLQEQIAAVSNFKGKDPFLSARKVINQFVKIGFINPFLKGYHPLVKSYIREGNKEKKKIIFSKIFYENSSLASGTTVDNRNLKHINFLLKTMDKKRFLNKNDIMALMVTDITNYRKGYLTNEELEQQQQYVIGSEFYERKYNQLEHLIGYLKRFVDLKYDKKEEKFWFANDPTIVDKNDKESYLRDGVRHRIYKKELKEESKELYGEAVCYLDKKPYKSLVASHIKPCIDCLKEHQEEQAYDINNGLLLSPSADSYFDKKEISFTDEGNVLIGKNVADAIRRDFEMLSIDKKILNESRKRYLSYHRELFTEKNGGN